jgi:hypothetical protein
MHRLAVLRPATILLGSLAVLALELTSASGQAVSMTNQTRQALSFYGGQSAVRTLSGMPRRTPIQPSTTGQMPHNGKPFQLASTGPTVSPYLNLFLDNDETTEAAPNYYAFVRPQLEQQAANQEQQREVQRLQRQIRGGAQSRTVPQYGASSVPGAGSPARFMDTAQFYGGWQR